MLKYLINASWRIDPPFLFIVGHVVQDAVEFVCVVVLSLVLLIPEVRDVVRKVEIHT